MGLTNGVPQTNNILAGGIIYYQVNVPTNADFATNTLLYTLNGRVEHLVRHQRAADDCHQCVVVARRGHERLSILSTTSAPTNMVPGSTYYLGVQNTNSFAVNYGIEVDFHLVAPTVQPQFQHHSQHQHQRNERLPADVVCAEQ